MKTNILLTVLMLSLTTPMISQWETPEKAASQMEYVLKHDGFDVEVTVKTVGGVSEFWFEVQKWYRRIQNLSSTEQNRQVGVLYGGIVGAVGTVTEKTSWKSDRAWVTVNEKEIAYFYTKDCRKALKIPKSEVPDFIVRIKHNPTR